MTGELPPKPPMKGLWSTDVFTLPGRRAGAGVAGIAGEP